MSFRTSTPSEQPMQAAKWLDVQALLDTKEFSQLFEDLGSPLLFQTGCVCTPGEESISKEKFISIYSNYIETLKTGRLPAEKDFRAVFSAAMTITSDMLFSLPVSGEKHILRIARPVVQMQFHRLGFSRADMKFRPMAFGTESISWGIQFSYPQLFQDMTTNEVYTVNESPSFPNTTLFRAIQRWMRHHTIPTPFVVDEKKINASIRIGKKCLSWVNHHPQLSQQKIRVVT